ncbi:MAG: extracellular solute-binding protein [Clostridia bacterium]|nr:extracellular solute-binding protein [Clostridia bacterium]
MKKNRLSCLFLALLMLASCGAPAADETTADTSADTAAAETETVAETDSLEARQAVTDDLGEHDFGGEDYRMLIQERWLGYHQVEELTGDVLNDAIYTRNSTVEERFNVNLTMIGEAYDVQMQSIKNAVISGNDEYDLYLGHSVYSGDLAVQGYLLNLHDLDIDFTKPWYPSDAVENLTVNGKMFLAASDVCLSLAANTYCYYFNKDLVTDYGLEDPYTVVSEGKWTIDYLLQNVATIYTDANGDGIVANEDIYGFATEKTNSLVPYYYAFEIDTVELTKEGVNIIFDKNEKNIDAVEKLRTLLYGSQGSYAYTGDGAYTSGADLFVIQNTIFAVSKLGDSANWFREACDFDYGIIPYPKYTEEQENYYTVAGGSINSSAIPITAGRTELISTIYAAMAAESWKILIPQYYDVVLKYKGARDETSTAMIDLILDGRNLDFEFIYDGFKGYMYDLSDICKGGTTVPAYVASTSNAVTTYYETIRDMFYAE